VTLSVELWSVPDCPLVGQVRAALYECLAHTGLDVDVRERRGPHPSPTLVVDGIDVATGNAPVSAVCCRLDLPTHDQIHAALTGAEDQSSAATAAAPVSLNRIE
jgi:hypothetical protein